MWPFRIASGCATKASEQLRMITLAVLRRSWTDLLGSVTVSMLPIMPMFADSKLPVCNLYRVPLPAGQNKTHSIKWQKKW